MTVRTSRDAINLREKLSELDKPSGIAGQDILKADTPQEVFNYIGAGRRNLLINSGFEVSQRGDYSSDTSTGQNAYRIDRWKHLVASVTCNTRRDVNQTVNGELMNVWRIEATSTATGRFGIRQYVEATSTGRTPTAGKPTTLSVWMRSNNPNARIYVYDYGKPGILNSHTSHSGSGQWEKLSITFIPNTGSVTANGNALEVNFVCTTTGNSNVSVTSGDYIEIAQPQLELGSVATPFEHRSYGEELALCQRYYQKIDGGNYAYYPSGRVFNSTTLVAYQQFTVPMRANPSLSWANMEIFDGNNRSVSNVVINGVSEYACGVNYISSGLTTGAVASPVASSNNKASYLAFDAEL